MYVYVTDLRIISNLRAHFNLINAPQDQRTLLGKFGFKTISSGSVEIKINTVHQTMPLFSEDDQKYKRVALKDKYGRPGVQLVSLN